ncbi:multidrug resistance protein Stp [Streptomyces platensis]|uniref:Multidrug resistance protein stp n=1 Tax=Streptomyces platensis TaxID=58346 RepID=A0ABX3Y4K6_STRPT|nr:MFS transporter [Streptomyces platensis]OSY48071.1 Multidrug resistance protein stp [Streptomyces platensis]
MSGQTAADAGGSAPSGPESTGNRPRLGLRSTVLVACLAFFVITLDTTVVNVALPSIGQQWGGQVSALQWVVTAYTLLFAALLLSAGTISDRIGASRAFTIGLSVFTLMSALCGLAPNLTVLIAARAIQGAGAAVMMPASLALVRQAYDSPAQRARAIALWTAGGGAAVAAGPVVGGALTTGLGWRWIFFVNLPVGVFALVGMLRAPRSPRGHSPMDPVGQVTAVLALAALVFAVITGGSGGWTSPTTICGFLVAVLAGTAFLLVESRQSDPAVPLTLFRIPSVAVCTSAGLALNFGYYGLVFVFTIFFQEHRGASALTAGLMFLPMTAFTTLVNLLAGKLTNRYGPRLPLILGQVIQTVGILGLLLVRRDTPTPLLLALLVPLGIGGGLAIPPLTSAMLESVPHERAGLASGVLSAARQFGGAIGVALLGALIADSAHFMTGMRISLVVGAAVLVATTLGVALFLPGSPKPAAPSTPAPGTEEPATVSLRPGGLESR